VAVGLPRCSLRFGLGKGLDAEVGGEEFAAAGSRPLALPQTPRRAPGQRGVGTGHQAESPAQLQQLLSLDDCDRRRAVAAPLAVRWSPARSRFSLGPEVGEQTGRRRWKATQAEIGPAGGQLAQGKPRRFGFCEAHHLRRSVWQGVGKARWRRPSSSSCQGPPRKRLRRTIGPADCTTRGPIGAPHARAR